MAQDPEKAKKDDNKDDGGPLSWTAVKIILAVLVILAVLYAALSAPASTPTPASSDAEIASPVPQDAAQAPSSPQSQFGF
jgi:hypothetical protein